MRRTDAKLYACCIFYTNQHKFPCQESIRTPQAKRSLTVLPHLDRPVLAASGIQLSIWGEADAPDWTVVALMDI
jgi:hypothetical protein